MRTDIFEFNDYRSYLQARFEERKRSSTNFNLAAWARRLSLKSSSTLIMILKGDRNPGPSLMEDLISDLELHLEAAEHFRNLVQLDKAKTNPHLRAMILNRLPKLPQPNLQLMKMKYFRLTSQWYFMAIRELVDLPGFLEDVEWIQSRLRFQVSKPQIKEALQILTELGLLQRDEGGTLRYSGAMTTTFDVPNEEIQRFHKGAFDLCRQAMDQIPTEQRETLNVIFSCNAQDLPLIREAVRGVLANLGTLPNKENDSVFMLQVACLPLSNPPSNKKSDRQSEGEY